MFTAPKLLAGVCLAALGYLVSLQVIEVWPEQRNFGNFALINAGFGFLVGWRLVGRQVRADTTLSDMISHAITAPIVLVALALFLQVGNEVLDRALARQYDGPVEAIYAMIPLGFDFLTKMAYPHIAATLFGGGLVAVLVTRFAATRWR
ncbi:TrgA family protein [Pseudooceanicola aestuarii]|uniref:TrgA family protein n=1 Tax=Pseudooceanicola aestuarii TaxID=2697319 RepID=UPI0013D3964D|nr:TrgA family protein [Pseudooceanicola aestuarii]